MRVVGGKTGTDGRLFAYLVWTVPGGPAEKNGLQQGDKVSNEITNLGTIRDIIYRVCVYRELHETISYVICCGQVLEWNSYSLVDRSFEEVCAIMDRTGDTVELLVEHAADFRMCDLLDESTPLNPGSGSGTGGSGRKPAEDLSGLIPGNRFFVSF